MSLEHSPARRKKSGQPSSAPKPSTEIVERLNISQLQELRLADDLIIGAKPIADHMGVPARRIFYWGEQRILKSLFKIGNLWAARKSKLEREIEQLENAA